MVGRKRPRLLDLNPTGACEIPRALHGVSPLACVLTQPAALAVSKENSRVPPPDLGHAAHLRHVSPFSWKPGNSCQKILPHLLILIKTSSPQIA
jgi:hypothetical protein